MLVFTFFTIISDCCMFDLVHMAIVFLSYEGEIN